MEFSSILFSLKFHRFVGFLKITGLELDKCFFCLIMWGFDNEGVPHLCTLSESEAARVDIVSSVAGHAGLLFLLYLQSASF